MPFVFDFDHKHRKPPMEMKDLLGGKGANLAEMTSVLGLPVPPGFTISTDACRAYMDGGWPDGLTEEVAEARARLEKAMGKVIGDPSDPLLVSVRSGAKFSMPGMMDTVLNLGLNDQSVEGLAKQTGDERFALRLVPPVRRHVRPDRPRHSRRGVRLAVRRGEGAGRDGLGRPGPDGAAPLPRRLVPADRRAAHRPAVPPGPRGPAQRGDRGGLPELERPAGDRLPRPRAHPALARDRGQRPGDGLRQPGRPVRDRCRLHPRPGDRRQGRVRRLPRQRPGGGRRRRHPQHGAALGAEVGVPEGPRGAPRHLRPARAPLPRHVRHGVHDRAGQALDAPDAGRQADGSGRARRWPST